MAMLFHRYLSISYDVNLFELVYILLLLPFNLADPISVDKASVGTVTLALEAKVVTFQFSRALPAAVDNPGQVDIDALAVYSDVVAANGAAAGISCSGLHRCFSIF